MKKLLFILISLLFIPVVFAEENVEIKSIEMDSKSKDAIELNKPTFDGLDMNLDISLKKVGDYVKYKVLVKNNSSNNYKLTNDKKFEERDFVKYTYESKNKELKADGTMEMLVTVEYSKEVAPGSFINEKYSDSNEAIVELLGVEEQVNPKTSTNIIMFIVLFSALAVLLISVIMIKKRVSAKYVTMVLLFFFVSVPFIVNAIDGIKIKLNVKVEIEKTYRAFYAIDYEGYYTEEEIANLSDLEVYCESDKYYIGELEEENIYKRCYIYEVVEDENRYYAGETVVIPNLVRSSKKLKGFCDFVDDKLVCPDGLITYSTSSEQEYRDYKYSKFEVIDRGFTFLDDDLDVMNFRKKNGTPIEIDDPLKEEIEVYAGLIYTMPKHDVYFDIVMPL